MIWAHNLTRVSSNRGNVDMLTNAVKKRNKLGRSYSSTQLQTKTIVVVISSRFVFMIIYCAAFTLADTE